MLARILCVATCAASFAAHAVYPQFEHPYGELVDVGPTSVRLYASAPHWFDCDVPAQVRIADGVVRIQLRGASYAGPVPACGGTQTVEVGVLAAGWWRAEIVVLRRDLTAIVDTSTSEFKVGRPESMCNEFAGTDGGVVVEHKTLSAPQFVNLVNQSAAFRELLGDPVEVDPSKAPPGVILRYPPLENPYDIRARLLATGEFAQASVWGPTFSGSVVDSLYASRVVEYYHAGLDTYFYTWFPGEIAALDEGVHIRGWTRSGESFTVISATRRPDVVGVRTAYRFYGKPGVGPPSHFFSVQREECHTIAGSSAWLYEGVPFWADPPDAHGRCRGSGVPLYRLWRPFGASTHRYTTQPATVAAMKQRGWIDEGVAMCVLADY